MVPEECRVLAPVASLTVTSSTARPSACKGARDVPPLALHSVASTGARRRLTSSPHTTHAPQYSHHGSRSSQSKPAMLRSASVKQWTIPLVTGAVLLHFARKAGAHLLPALLPRRLKGGNFGGPGMPGGRKPALVWFRNDLRLHDHEPLAAACSSATSVLPVYIFDPREYGKSPNGFDKTGPYRARFILEALHDLRSRLREAGSDLVVRVGKPEVVLPELSRAVGAGAVYCHGEVTVEEAGVETAVKKALDKSGAALKVLWGNTLFHVDDLPFKLPSMPSNYSEFRRALRGRSVRSPVETPAEVKALPAASVSPGDIPGLRELGFDAATLSQCASDNTAAGAHLRGGETEALRRLGQFVQQFKQQATNKRRSGEALCALKSSVVHRRKDKKGAAPDFCCKISPWLALGCLSPRQLYVQLQHEVGEAGQESGLQQQIRSPGDEDNTGVQWLLFELLWRDFFKFITKKYTVTGVARRTAGTAKLQSAVAAPVPAAVLAV